MLSQPLHRTKKDVNIHVLVPLAQPTNIHYNFVSRTANQNVFDQFWLQSLRNSAEHLPDKWEWNLLMLIDRSFDNFICLTTMSEGNNENANSTFAADGRWKILLKIFWFHSLLSQCANNINCVYWFVWKEHQHLRFDCW